MEKQYNKVGLVFTFLALVIGGTVITAYIKQNFGGPIIGYILAVPVLCGVLYQGVVILDNLGKAFKRSKKQNKEEENGKAI